MSEAARSSGGALDGLEAIVLGRGGAAENRRGRDGGAGEGGDRAGRRRGDRLGVGRR